MRSWIAMALVAAAAAGMWADDVEACSCPRLEPCAADAGLVFIGLVTSSRDLNGVQHDTWEVDEVIQGDAPEELELRRDDAFGCNLYGTEPTVVVVLEDDDGPYTHGCSASQDEKDLARARACNEAAGCSVGSEAPGSPAGLALAVVLLGWPRRR